MQRFEKSYERGGLRRAQILGIRGHISASLDHLADELVLREPDRDTIESGASLPSALLKRMTVAALLRLKDERALPLQGGCAVQKSRRQGGAAPGVHLRTPRRVLRQMGKRSERNREQQHSQDRNRSSSPALLSFAGQERKQEKSEDGHDRTNQKRGSLHRRWEQREQGIEPQEKVIGFRHGLNNGGVRPAGRPKRTEPER